MRLFKAYNAFHSFDIIFLSEIYLNHDTLLDDDNLSIRRYQLMSRDDPSANQERGGVCMNYKSFLLKKKTDTNFLSK